MNFLYKLEKRLGKFAIPNLMFYLLVGQSLVFFLMMINSNYIIDLIFSWPAIKSGQIWRLVTFIIIPSSTSILWFLIMILVYYSIGTNLERTWGTFNFNFYYFSSIICVIIVGAIFNHTDYITGAPLIHYVNLSLFLSFATLVPEATFYIYFVLPVKAKYMVFFYFIILGADVFSAFMVSPVAGLRQLAIISASLIGYIIFFAIPKLKRKQYLKKAAPAQQAYKKSINKSQIPKGEAKPIKVAFHKCHVCGKTELDDPNMEFRYCSKCNGHYEYCMDHLRNHEHID